MENEDIEFAKKYRTIEEVPENEITDVKIKIVRHGRGAALLFTVPPNGHARFVFGGKIFIFGGEKLRRLTGMNNNTQGPQVAAAAPDTPAISKKKGSVEVAGAGPSNPVQEQPGPSGIAPKQVKIPVEILNQMMNPPVAGIAARGGAPVVLQARPVQAQPPSGGAAAAGPGDKQAAAVIEVPERIYDPQKRKSYIRGRFLGKGGFARCYEVTEMISRQVLACKVVNKSLLVKPHQREKMAQEITIHRGLKHDFVVDFHSYFEDDQNVYILLELCGKKSLMEMQKRRRVISEPEARYFLRQIILAVEYLHDEQHIIHRDLKLGNIFITDELHLKIGDFGLATRIDFEGERKRTLCGTPNYIAPEVLAKRGHSYEVDVWSIGCILYTLLLGKPPFETATLRDTYHRIRRGEYEKPKAEKISASCRALMSKMLQVDPALRPTAKQILNSDFLTHGLLPASLPASVLTMAPRFERNTASNAGLLNRIEVTGKPKQSPLGDRNQMASPSVQRKQMAVPHVPALKDIKPIPTPSNVSMTESGELTNADILELMRSLREQMVSVIESSAPIAPNDDESEDPSLCPMLWICKWVDYSDKYGFGYQLSDDSIGVSFNDQTKVILLADSKGMHYIDKNGQESYYSVDNFPVELQKKVKLLNYFEQYMKENLLKASGGKSTPDTNCIARLPNLWTWFRTSRAVVMVLTNGTLQINNFRDHTKMIVCPLLGAISTLGSNKSLRTFKMATMSGGISNEMLHRLKYAVEKLDVIIGNPKHQLRPKMMQSPAKRSARKNMLK